MILQDYICNKCEHQEEYLLNKDEKPTCSKCQSDDMSISLGGNLFTTIVPSYPGSKKLKAGYMHEYRNRPAEKISVPVGGPKRK